MRQLVHLFAVTSGHVLRIAGDNLGNVVVVIICDRGDRHISIRVFN